MTTSPKGLIGPTLLATKARLKKASMKARLIRLDVDTYSIGTLYFVVLTNYYYLVALLSAVCIARKRPVSGLLLYCCHVFVSPVHDVSSL